MHPLTLVFDLDGTLIDTAPDLVGATNHALAGVGIAPVAAAELRPWISFGARRMIVEALATHNEPMPEHKIDELLANFLTYYEANIATESRPFAGSVDAIARFKAAGCRLAICTNKREALSRALLNALDMADTFDALAGRDTLAFAKPHPGHVLGAIDLAGGNAGNAIMIGDSKVDIEAARAAGVPVVACSFGYADRPIHEFAPDAIIGHYDELDDAVAQLTKGRMPVGSR